MYTTGWRVMADIFAIGDIAYMESPEWPKGHPQLANVAINQAKHLAKNMKMLLEKEPLKHSSIKIRALWPQSVNGKPW